MIAIPESSYAQPQSKLWNSNSKLENKNKRPIPNKYGTQSNYFQYMDDFTNGALERPKHQNKANSQIF